MLDYLLPIGSVVRLEKGRRKLMICGLKQTNSETGILYDYLGVLYPQGHMGQQFTFLFNHDMIEEVIQEGYADDEWYRFRDQLAEILARHAAEREEEDNL